MQAQLTHFLITLGKQRGYSDNTTAAYRNDLSQFVRFVHSRFDGLSDASSVTAEAMAEFVADLNTHRYASATVARKIAAVKSFFHFLNQEGLIAHDPTHGITAPRVRKQVPRALNSDALERLVSLSGRTDSPKSLRDRALLELLCATGMRVTEAVGLRVEDVDLDRNVVTCRGRGALARELPMQAAAASVGEYLHKGRPSMLKDPSQSALFLNHRGQRLTRQGLWLIIKEVAGRAGISERVSPHTLRHSFARRLLADGMELRQLQAILGHASLATTQTYLQVGSDHHEPPDGR